MKRGLAWLPLAVALATAGHAFAETPATTSLPGEESGRIDSWQPAESPVRVLGRGLLFVPRLVIDIVFAPVRGAVWALDRYQLVDRAKRAFFNDAETIGAYPIAELQSGFGLTAGGRFVARDLFGQREHFSARAGAGGRYQQIYSVRAHSGDRFGTDSRLELEAEYERRPKEPFYGIGNTGEGAETRFRQRLARTTLVGDFRLAGDLHLLPAAAVADLAFDVSDSDSGTPIDQMYETASLTGFDGYRYGYGELELRWDSRRREAWDPPTLFSTGWLAAAYAGRVALADGRTDFTRYGADLQRFFRLTNGPRVLVARAHAEGVTGPVDVVPFNELPQLGGKALLRGYPAERFRDRIGAVGSLEYQWDLNRMVTSSIFVDAGRVYASSDELSVRDMRVGYGLSLELHTDGSYIGRMVLASSIDGGVFLDLSFDPAFDLDTRVERR